MKIFVYIFFFFTTSISFPQEKESVLELWTYSLGDLVSESAHETISKDWPFTTKAMAGDLLDDFIVEKIDRHNQQLWEFLEEKGYIEPETIYFEEVRKEETKIKRALDLVYESPKAIRLFQKIRKKKQVSSADLIKMDEMKYFIKLYSYDAMNYADSTKYEMGFIIDLNTNKVSSLNEN